MRQFLLAILLTSPAYAGGDDGFSGGGSAFGSSFGNGFSGGGYGDTMSANARDGFRGNSTVDSLQSFDDGHGGVRTYQHNPYHETEMLVSISGDGWGGYGGPSMPMAEGIGGRSVEQMLADKQAREAPKPTPMPTLTHPPAAPEPAPTAPEVDMGSIGSAVIELQPPPTPQGIVEDPVNTALRAIEGIVVNDQHGALTQEQKRVAAALNLGTGALLGRGARGNHRLAQLTGRPKTLELNAAEGAIIGAAVAEARRQAKGDKTPFDDFVRSLTEFSRADAARARREVANQIKDPERRANFLDSTKDVRETQERKDRDDKRADRKGGKGKTGRGNPDY